MGAGFAGELGAQLTEAWGLGLSVRGTTALVVILPSQVALGPTVEWSSAVGISVATGVQWILTLAPGLPNGQLLVMHDVGMPLRLSYDFAHGRGFRLSLEGGLGFRPGFAGASVGWGTLLVGYVWR